MMKSLISLKKSHKFEIYIYIYIYECRCEEKRELDRELVDTNGDNFNRNMGFCSHVKNMLDRLIELSLISSMPT